jgi:hypothetical protein
MPKYIIKHGQRVTHGDRGEAVKHFAKMQPGQTFASFPPAPVRDYEEGEEVELSEEEAAAMPWAVATPEEFERAVSPKAFMAKGYTRDEAESMAASRKAELEARTKARKARAARGALPGPASLPGGGMAPTDGSTEVNPRVAGKFPDDAHRPDEHKKPQR